MFGNCLKNMAVVKRKAKQTLETKCDAGVFWPYYSEVSDAKYLTAAFDSPAAHHKEVTVEIPAF